MNSSDINDKLFCADLSILKTLYLESYGIMGFFER